jgi:hypothetical protein
MTDLSWNKIKRLVQERANFCCEYCRTCIANTGQTLHIDHIDPDGGDSLDNLCAACANCNLSKAQLTQALDRATITEVALFNPRTQVWSDHFKWSASKSMIRGLTPTGRVTIQKLRMNRKLIMNARKRWAKHGFHPPD